MIYILCGKLGVIGQVTRHLVQAESVKLSAHVDEHFAGSQALFSIWGWWLLTLVEIS